MAPNPPEFRPDNAALILIDTQQQWVPMIPARDRLIGNLKTLIRLAKGFEMPIVVAEHLPWVIGETIPELLAELPPETPVIKKDVYNTWDDKRFTEAVEATGRGQLVFCGIETHVCMGMPALEALRRGYEVFIPTDCTDAQSPVDRDTAFQRFWQAGAVPVTWNTLIFEGLRQMSLEGGMPANERSAMVSEVWLGALPHIVNQFHYASEADPAANAVVV
jgi:nicotinamidase-related amidase